MSAAFEHQQPGSACTSRVWPQLLPELADKIVGCLDSNEVPCFRLVNKASASQFCAPHHTTYRLSQPVPPRAFAAHWLIPGAVRGLTLERRQQLLSLTAASGVVANLEVAEKAAGCLLTNEVLKAAARAGQLDACVWLWEHGSRTVSARHECSNLLGSAASGGHLHVCEWLLSLGLAWETSGADAAARAGHVRLMEWLLQRRPQMDVAACPVDETRLLLAGVAHGCDLPTLQRLWRGWGEVDDWSKREAMGAAVCSPTPDWAAKVEWLQAQGCPRNMPMMEAQRPDAVARLVWLRAQGFAPQPVELRQAAAAGNVAAVQYLLGELGQRMNENIRVLVFTTAARNGHVHVLQALHVAGRFLPVDAFDCAREAARNGHLHVLAWLVETFGGGAVRMGPGLLTAAAESGSVQLMAWLRERGCKWDVSAFTAAANSGCEEAVEWLVAQGCPVQGNGDPYSGACRNGDLAMATGLRRLGVPWGPAGAVAVPAARGAPLPLLRWLLEEGCPLGCIIAFRRAVMQRASGREEALGLLQAYQQRLGGEASPSAAIAGGLAV
ncbi:hypothetical protein GPECTOR_37g193 [Gonium pectorale]|uniref:Ankyrin repeat domain-containing protein n=1 Tax=Gonium pectorale TaxID=33097 RepID=A0A150GBG0_GONPE|nr:hypothetical protein GPECTOR_37g193 [Gonium pectorale]|eukprot:KXZ47187.1 hypothetical protein GPECTOR_37g193 [Gonium pectorale]